MICLNCGNKTTNKKYCSLQCKYLSQGKKINIQCKTCKNTFSIVESVIKKGKGIYCSRECYLGDENNKMSHWPKNKKHSEETKLKISKNRKGKNTGKRPKSLVDKISGENNYGWKGEKASYFAIHAKIGRQKGKAKKCGDCGTEKGKIEWANINHKYSRNPDDYISKCIKCHRKYDIKNNNYRVFNRTLVK